MILCYIKTLAHTYMLYISPSPPLFFTLPFLLLSFLPSVPLISWAALLLLSYHANTHDFMHLYKDPRTTNEGKHVIVYLLETGIFPLVSTFLQIVLLHSLLAPFFKKNRGFYIKIYTFSCFLPGARGQTQGLKQVIYPQVIDPEQDF